MLSAARSVLVARGLDASVLPAGTAMERPRNPEHGDYASTLALQVAKKVGLASRDLAVALADELSGAPGIKAVEVAGPGFLNIRLDAAAAGELAGRLRTALAGIDPRQAEVFCLVCLDDFSYRDAADQIGITANHAGVLLTRARAALRERLRAFDPANQPEEHR